MKYLLFVLLISACFNLFCQAKKDILPDGLRNNLITIAANKNKISGCRFPFSGVKVSDCRFDTSKIGFMRKGDRYTRGKYMFKRMIVKSGLQFAVENFYTDYYKDCFSNDSTKLLVLIKRFWADPFPDKTVQLQSTDISRESNFDLYVQVEFLLQRADLYLPVKRVDTVFQLNPSVLDHEYEDFKNKKYSIYEYALAKVFESVNYQLYADRFNDAKSKKTLPDVERFNKARFNYPVLQDSILKKGVYLSFAEFRNNQPSVPEYKVEKKKQTGYVLYNMTGSDSVQIIKYWGCSDGENIYCGLMHHPLIRAGNTFEFFNDKAEYNTYDVPVLTSSGYLVTGSFKVKKNVLEPFQIDMETGKIY
jgi:hypothetical protein